MKSILESNGLVETAKVSVTGIKAYESNYRRRDSRESSEYVMEIAEFIAACYVRYQTQLDMVAIRRVQQSLKQSIESSVTFSLTNKPLVVVKPKVITIKAQPIANKTEIKEKIGESTIESDITFVTADFRIFI